MKKLNIAIVGLGNIGSYLFKYLKKNKKILAKKIIVYPISYTYLPKTKNGIEASKLIKKYG